MLRESGFFSSVAWRNQHRKLRRTPGSQFAEGRRESLFYQDRDQLQSFIWSNAGLLLEKRNKHAGSQGEVWQQTLL